MKILLVEDSAIDRHEVGKYLTEWGLDYAVVDNGTEAVKLFESPHPPNLVLLDWLLPGIDGIDVCREIRKLGKNGPYTYTVMLTAKSRKQDLLMAFRTPGANPRRQENTGTSAVPSIRRDSRFSNGPAKPRRDTFSPGKRMVAE